MREGSRQASSPPTGCLIRSQSHSRLSRSYSSSESDLAGCSKRLASKAADESKPEAYPQGYVEDFDEPRTKLAGFFGILRERGLPGPEGTAIEMDELRARIKPHPTVPQLQRGMAKLTRLDIGNIEVERLPLDM